MTVHRLNPESLASPVGYAHVATVSGATTIYVAGQVATNREGRVVGPGDFAAQVEQAFANLRLALAAAGARPADVVRTGMYVVGYEPQMLAVLREARERFFEGAAPATSTLVGVAALAAPEFLFEVDAVAAIA